MQDTEYLYQNYLPDQTAMQLLINGRTVQYKKFEEKML